MSRVTVNQPDGTPTWIELAVPDLDRATAFYRALFGWEYADGPGYTTCLLRGLPIAALKQASAARREWTMYFAADDCDATAKRVAEAGGTLVAEPAEVDDEARTAIAEDPTGARFGLWQGRSHPGCQLVNEPGTLVRNDLVTAATEPARAFYPRVFDHTLDRNEDMPGFDFTFLRLADGHEIGGIFGLADAKTSSWATLFEVDGTDAVADRAREAGGTAAEPEDGLYGRTAVLTDPFGVEFSIITRP
ncbi:VOC family protein [Amycolatopsis sp.]|uniref:VOC family protein n=1 Tax=Amycolatopsis sp. TaxID=37632 RepID=UPI002DFA6441|nr:VOC family protein [Amycolatopsis sp.]